MLTWNKQTAAEKALTVLSLPFLIPVSLTVPLRLDRSQYGLREISQRQTRGDDGDAHSSSLPPRVDSTSRHSTRRYSQILASHWLPGIQMVLGPQLFTAVLLSQTAPSSSASLILLSALFTLLLSLLSIVYTLTPVHITQYPYTPTPALLTSTIAFAISLTWIFLTATSAVSLLITLSLILSLPPALLGATVFAVGQSSNDLVANAAVARRGMPVLAASATFGGPTMNMFLGIGGGGLVQVLKRGRFEFRADKGVFISAACLWFGLALTLGYAFWNGWRLDRRLRLTLISVWSLFTVLNVVVGLTG